MKIEKKSFILKTSSSEETFRFGKKLGEFLSKKVFIDCFVILLEGNLGAGKTCFTKGLAAGLGIDESEVSSPTFTLINEYQGNPHKLYHLDLYRLSPETDFRNTLGLDEILDEPSITVIEWAERCSLTFNSGIHISIKILKNQNRKITLQILSFTNEKLDLLNLLESFILK